ncbi:MAG: CbiX/SirB N-terminal domain-containing protein [Candidatus Omnitrophica bacterium]|nr:CbiX/SirB N-terminal domain-containing protein [Candidatus Omnitrophota bacterium]
MKAILLVSHGSREPKARAEIELLARSLEKRSDISIVEPAFLEIESPGIPEGIQRCVDKGAGEIIVLLNFLNSGKHASADIPKIINRAREHHPDVRFRITKPLGRHDVLVDLFLKLINEA